MGGVVLFLTNKKGDIHMKKLVGFSVSVLAVVAGIYAYNKWLNKTTNAQ